MSYSRNSAICVSMAKVILYTYLLNDLVFPFMGTYQLTCRMLFDTEF